MEPQRILKCVLCILLCASLSAAEIKKPPETRNAALRYWLAFADLQDPPADKGIADLLEKTAAGEAAWDEARLGPILDKNEDAILAMQRATKLPECDWGLEYDLGPRASIAYAPRARVLARLNTLYGMRLAAKGNTQEAVNAWLAGIRFSQHLAQGGTLIFALIAEKGLLSNFHALTQAAQSASLTAAQGNQVENAVHALPQAGFDWSAALEFEADPVDIAVKQLKAAKDPAEYFEGATGMPAPKDLSLPTGADTAAFHRLMTAAAEALRLPPQQAQERLKVLQESVKNLHAFYAALTPSFVRVNEARIQVEAAREKLLQSLGSR